MHADQIHPVAGSGRPRLPVLRSVGALILREMSTRYGRSPGGYFWALAQPIGGIAILAFAFSLILRTPPLGNSFVLFFASGVLPFAVFLGIQAAVQNALQFSRPLLMYPAVSWIDALFARFILEFLTTTIALIVVLGAVFELTGASAILRVGPMIGATLLMAALGFGIGVFNCALAGLYPAWGNLWQIVTRPLFLVAGVIFIYDRLPSQVQEILWFTPWIHLTGLFRIGIYPSYHPEYISLPLVAAWVMIPMALGLLLLRRHHRTILMD